MSDSEDQFIQVKDKRELKDYENNLAWGKKKANFYQEAESEYSEIQDEEDEAQNILNKFAQEVEDQDFNLENKNITRQHLDLEPDTSDYADNIKMLKSEIRNILKKLKYFEGKELEEYEQVFQQGKLSLISQYVNVHQAYVMTMIMLLKMYQANTPHLEEHSIMKRLQQLKVLCNRFQELQNLIKNQVERIEDGQEQSLQQQEQEENHKYKQQSKEDSRKQNLKKYEQLVTKHKKIKKQKQRERKLEKISVIPSKAFAEVKQEQARLINYTISANKGLTRRRGKKDKSSRAKNRAKFEKKMIKYRSANPMYKDPGLGYGGEIDIKQGKIQSTRLS